MARFIAAVSIVSISLLCDSSIVATYPSIPAAFCLRFIRFVFVVRSCFVWLTKAEQRSRVGRPQTSSSSPLVLLLAVPRRLFCFGSLVILDVVCRYLSLFLLLININIGKHRFYLLD